MLGEGRKIGAHIHCCNGVQWCSHHGDLRKLKIEVSHEPSLSSYSLEHVLEGLYLTKEEFGYVYCCSIHNYKEIE